ncbi:MAG: hypothetical protein GF347_04950 [Candidatus Moranbacteria bacterium]|nr:hypothetical protein [Candidatus Moranbacteria bacterium]
MQKSIISLFCLLLLSGCSLIPKNETKGVYKSSDKGETFEQKVKYVEEEKTLGIVDVLNLTIDPNDHNIIYAGTKGSGLFKSTDGGEVWNQVTKGHNVYAIAIDRRNSNNLYIGAVFESRGRILRSTDGGESWESVWEEPAGENFIPAVEVDYYNPNVIYAGNSNGTIYKSLDRGDKWLNIGQVKGQNAIVKMAIDPQNRNSIYLRVFEEGIMKIDYTKMIEGKDLEEFEESEGMENFNINESKYALEKPPIINLSENFPPEADFEDVFSLEVDPKLKDVVYVGTDIGIFKSMDGGVTWGQLSTLENPEGIRIRAMAIGGYNSDIIYYTSRGVFYKSFDGGLTWQSTELKIPHPINDMAIDPANPDLIYLGAREFD